MPSIPPLDACRDSQLFGIVLYPMQERMLQAVAFWRLLVWCLGRRSGKTTAAALVLLWCCLFRPELRSRLRPGELGYAVGIAVNLRQARLLVDAARSVVKRSPLLASLIEAETEDQIVFKTGWSWPRFRARVGAGEAGRSSRL